MITTLPNKSLEPTRVSAFSSAFAVHAFWSRVPELWSLGVFVRLLFSQNTK